MVEENAKNAQVVEREEVYAALRMAYDPLYAVNILEMGLVEHIGIIAGAITIMLYKPYEDARSCDDLIQNVLRAVQHVPGGVSCAVGFVASPVWDVTMLSPSLRHMFGLDNEEHHRQRWG